jgi:hypothetical protein
VELAPSLDGDVSMVLFTTGPSTFRATGRHLLDGAADLVALSSGVTCCRDLKNLPLVATVPRVHLLQLLANEHAPEVGHNVLGVVVGDACGPACADAFCPVDEHQWQNRHVPATSEGGRSSALQRSHLNKAQARHLCHRCFRHTQCCCRWPYLPECTPQNESK